MAKQRGQEVIDDEKGLMFGGGGGRKIVDDDATKVRTRPRFESRIPPPRPPPPIEKQSQKPKVDDGNGTGSDYEERLEFGRDTNRLDYFCVTPFDAYGDDDIGDIDIYGGSGGSNRTRQVPLDISMNNDNDNSDSSISRQVPVEVFADNGSGDEVLVQRLDQESSICGSERLIGEAGFWVRQWWEKWCLFLALWKTN